MRRLCSVLLAISGLLAWAAPAQATTDEQRLAAHLHGAEVAFPGCPQITVHIHADDILETVYPNDPNVEGMGRDCEVWLRSGMPSSLFRYALYHETYHATHCGCAADHGSVMDQAVALALYGAPIAKPARQKQRSAWRAHRRASLRSAARALRHARLAISSA